MNLCPHCHQELPLLAITCPHCQHDLLPPTAAPTEAGWEYSGLADLVLMAGAFVTGLAAIVLGFAAFFSWFRLFGNDRGEAIVAESLAFSSHLSRRQPTLWF